MAEHEPTNTPQNNKEKLQALQDELANRPKSLEEQIDDMKTIVDSEEAFGVYDKDVTPGDGEVSYQDYLKNRPREIHEDAGSPTGFREEGSKKFRGQDSYDRQNESTQHKFERDTNIHEQEVAQQYETMGVMALAKEAALARIRNDRADVEEIQDIAEKRLREVVENDRETFAGSESDKEKAADERFQKDIERFEALIAKFEQRAQEAEAKAEAATSSVETDGEASPAGTESAFKVGDSVVVHRSSGDVDNIDAGWKVIGTKTRDGKELTIVGKQDDQGRFLEKSVATDELAGWNAPEAPADEVVEAPEADAEVASADSVEEAAADAEPAGDAEVAPEAGDADAEQEADSPEIDRENGLFYKGEKVNIVETIETKDGRIIYLAESAEDPSERGLIFENELERRGTALNDPEQGDADTEPGDEDQEALDEKPADEVEADADEESAETEEKVPGKELELYVPGGEVVGLELDLPEEERKKSLVDRFKGLWKKTKDFFGVRVWNTLFQADNTINPNNPNTWRNAVNFGVKPEMSDEEKQKKRERNRTLILVGVGAFLGGGALGALITAGVNGAFDGGGEGVTPDLGGELGADTGADAGEGLPEGTQDVLDQSGEGVANGESTPVVADRLEDDNSEVVDVQLPTIPEYETNSFDAYNIPRGEGGIELFDKLGLTEAQWYEQQDYLVSNFPSDFRLLDDGRVWISHTGWLTPEAQSYIESLRS